MGARHGGSDGRSSAWERCAWAAGILFVVALVVEIIVAIGVELSQNDSAAKIANGLHAHETRLIVVACLSVVYAVMFVIYLSALYNLLRGGTDRTRVLGSLVLVGGVLFVTLHAVSDIGITGLVGAKLASYGAQHDPGVSYALYLMTFALESVGDVFGSLFAFATGALVLRAYPCRAAAVRAACARLKAIRPLARWRRARWFSSFLDQRIRIARLRLSHE